MKNIVIDARELRTSSGRYVERLLNRLQQLDKTHSFQVLLKPKDFDGWHNTNENFIKVTTPYKEFSFSEQFSFKILLNKLNPDLVHFTFPQQPILLHRPVITTIHDLTTLRFDNPDKNKVIFRIKQQIYKRIIIRAAHKSKYLFTASEYVKQDVVHLTGVSPEKIIVTYEAADPIIEKPEVIQGLVNKQFLMYIGRPTPHKNLERLIEAFVLLRPKHSDLKLVLAGKKDANYRRIEAMVEKKNISDVLFIDFVSERQLRWLYENCAAYVFPSLSEGFGLPGLEAMVHGAPVVSSNATCLPEIYGDAALYFDPENVTAICDAVNNVLIDEQLRSDLVAKGKLQAAKYSWKRMAEQTLEIYKRALGE